MNDSRDFQDAESLRSGNSHVSSRPAFFTPFPDPDGMLSRSLGMPSCNDGPPSIWDTHGISGNVFANSKVTGANDSVESFADLFTIGLRNDDIHEFDSKWEGFLINDENPT